MGEQSTTIKHPVRRNGAEMYLLTMLVCFGLSVALTRLFLELSGYPQLGNSELHIAHVLWGGLFLFLAVLVLLLFANAWVYPLGAVLGGIGMGLFIDEVGKFITQSNDYFYPWAAPIIYTFFLLLVMLYLRVNRQRPEDPRTEMYHALGLLTEVLDHDLEKGEKADLMRHLQAAATETDNPDLVTLAIQLMQFVNREEMHLALDKPDFWQRWEARAQALEEKYFTRRRFKTFLLVGMALLAGFLLIQLVVVAGVRFSPGLFTGTLINLIEAGQVKGVQGVRWFAGFAALNGSIGVLLIVSILLTLLGKERSGLNYGYFGLLLALTAANLLAFYFNQFSTIFFALAQLILLIGVIRYQRRFLT